MLTYEEIKAILYNSKEHNKIPVDYEESVPILCQVADNLYISFIYYSITDYKYIIHKCLLIDIMSGGLFDVNYKILFKLYRDTYEAKINLINHYKYRKLYEDEFIKFYNLSQFNELIDNIDLYTLLSQIFGYDMYQYCIANMYNTIKIDKLNAYKYFNIINNILES